MGWKKKVLKVLAPAFLAGALACGDNLQGQGGALSYQLFYQKGKTDRSGKVIINDKSFLIKDEYKPLENITVHYLESKKSYLALAVDEQGGYFPEITSGNSINSNTSQQNLKQPLWGEILLVMDIATRLAYDFQQDNWSRKKNLLEEQENVNRYCLTLEQMKNDYIDVPAGILLLAPELAGYETGGLKIALTTPLKALLEKHIITKYGRHSGYQVWEPKTRTSLCEEEYTGLVCKIDREILSKKLWNQAEVPLWRISGPCEVESTVEKWTEPNTSERENGEKVSSTLAACELPSCVDYFTDFCAVPCLHAFGRCTLPCSTDNDCRYEGVPMKCYDLQSLCEHSDLQEVQPLFCEQLSGKGCFLQSCEEGCPENTICLDVPLNYSKINFNFRPNSITLHSESCFDPQCLD